MPRTSSGLLSLFDFTGLPVGQPAIHTLGFFSLFDFTGLPVGPSFIPPPPAQSGFYGFLDFAGYPVGAGTGIIPPIKKGHGGFRGAGQPYLWQLARKQIRTHRQIHIPAKITRVLLHEYMQRLGRERQARYEKNITEAAIYSVLLAEI